MLKELSSPLSNKDLSNAQSGWNEAIADAEEQIGEALKRVRSLKGVIKTLEGLRDEGAEFPGYSDEEL